MVFKLDKPVQFSKGNFGYSIVPATKDTGPYAGANSLDEILAIQAAEIAAIVELKNGVRKPAASPVPKTRKSKRGVRRAG